MQVWGLLLVLACAVDAAWLNRLRRNHNLKKGPVSTFKFLWARPETMKNDPNSIVPASPARAGSRFPWETLAGAKAKNSGDPQARSYDRTASDVVHDVVSGGSAVHSSSNGFWGLGKLYGDGVEHNVWSRVNDFKQMDDLHPIAPMDWLGGRDGSIRVQAPWDESMYIAPYAFPDPFPAEEPDRTYAHGGAFTPKTGAVAEPSREIPIKAIRHGYSGKCLAGKVVAPCNDGPEQQWEYVAATGVLRNKVQETCLQIQAQPGGAGVQIGTGACHGRSNQKFDFTGGALHNHNVDQCLSVDQADKLILKYCSGKDDQTWQKEVKALPSPCFQYTTPRELLHAPEDKMKHSEYPLVAPADRAEMIPALAPQDHIPLRFAKYIDQVADKTRAIEQAQRKGCEVTSASGEVSPATVPPLAPIAPAAAPAPVTPAVPTPVFRAPPV